MKHERNVLIVALALLLVGSGQAAACWCIGTLQEDFDNSDAVFSGIVTFKELGSPFGESTRYELTVTACWKGVSEQGSTVTVWADAWSSCSWAAADVGEEWVIYAASYGHDFYTDQCDHNAQVPLPPEHDKFLGPSICDPASVEAETWGRIKATYR